MAVVKSEIRSGSQRLPLVAIERKKRQARQKAKEMRLGRHAIIQYRSPRRFALYGRR